MDIPILGGFAIDAAIFAVILLTAIIAVAIVAWKRRTALPRLAKALEMELGKEGSAQILTGTYANCLVYIRWSSRHDEGKVTFLSTTMKPCGFHLTITKEDSLAKVGEHEAVESVPIGDDHFDGAFAVRCGSREKAKQVVGEAVRGSIQAAGSVLKEGESIVVDNDRTTITLEKRYLKDANSIKKLLDAIVSVVNSVQGAQVSGAPAAPPKTPAAPSAPAAPRTPAPSTTPTPPTTPSE